MAKKGRIISEAKNENIEIADIIGATDAPDIIEDMGAQPFNWTTGYVIEMIDTGTMDLDILVQRGSVWSRKKDSLLIASILTMIPIQNCYMNKVDGVYGVVDGKQRLTAIHRFVKGEYKLYASTPSIRVNGKVFELAGYNFKSLPQTLQTRILNYPIRGDWFDNLTYEEEVKFFILTNSGKPVTAAEISRSRIKSKVEFIALSKHPAMIIAINEANRKKHKNIDIMSQLWCLCFGNVSSLLQKEIGTVLATTEITKEQENKLIQSFDYLTEYFKYIFDEDKKRLSKLQKPTHILSLGYMAFLAAQKKMDTKIFIDKAKALFNGEGRAVTNNERYNLAVGAGSAKGDQLRIRLEELEKALK